MSRTNSNMLQGPLAGGLLLYTIPIICTSVLQLLFNAADLMVVGRFCGSVSVAAVGATGAITNLIINLFVGLSVGAGVSTAHAIGSREDVVLHRTVHTAYPAALVSGAFLTVFGIAFSEKCLALMGTPENVLSLSASYMRIYFAGMTFTMIYNFCASILRAAGDTRSPLVLLSIAGCINVVLNVVFVRVFHMNVAGVALATVIAQAFSAVGVTLVLMHRKDSCVLHLDQLRFYKPQLVKMIRIGLPAGIQGSMFSISNVLIQSSINSFGDVVMSANAAAANLEGFCCMTVNAFHQTAVNYTGQNVGAGQYRRVRRVFLLCLVYVAAAGALTGGLGYLFRERLLSLYLTDSAEALACGAVRIAYTFLPYSIYGMMDVTTGALRGIGASMLSMVITVLGVCGIRVLWISTVFSLPQFHTPQCLYLSWPISWSVTLAVQLTAFVIVYRKQSARSAGPTANAAASRR